MKQGSLFGLDFLLLAAALALVATGLLFIYSSGVSSSGTVRYTEFIKQAVWAVTGLALMLLVMLPSPTRLRGVSFYLFGGTLLLLGGTLLFGRVVNGARSWIGIGELGVQPSEFAKLATILFLGTYLAGIGKGIRELPRFLIALGIVLVPVGLILLQPDFGTALVFFPIFLTMTFMAGARLRHLIFLIAVGATAIALSVIPIMERQIIGHELSLFSLLFESELTKYLFASLAMVVVLSAWGTLVLKKKAFYWILFFSGLFLMGLAGAQLASRILREYQIMRLVIFLNPRIDPRGAGWNILQSITAVGSGGFWGKGFLRGTQSHYRFLPQQSTDFIFSILAEEWGFLGGMLIFALFLVILIRGIRIAYTAHDDYVQHVCSGIVGMIFFHAVVNIGMAMGIMPITGLPLFFLSYGGSSLWTGLIGVGLLLGFYLRRYRF